MLRLLWVAGRAMVCVLRLLRVPALLALRVLRMLWIATPAMLLLLRVLCMAALFTLRLLRMLELQGFLRARTVTLAARRPLPCFASPGEALVGRGMMQRLVSAGPAALDWPHRRRRSRRGHHRRRSRQSRRRCARRVGSRIVARRVEVGHIRQRLRRRCQ